MCSSECHTRLDSLPVVLLVAAAVAVVAVAVVVAICGAHTAAGAAPVLSAPAAVEHTCQQCPTCACDTAVAVCDGVVVVVVAAVVAAAVVGIAVSISVVLEECVDSHPLVKNLSVADVGIVAVGAEEKRE